MGLVPKPLLFILQHLSTAGAEVSGSVTLGRREWPPLSCPVCRTLSQAQTPVAPRDPSLVPRGLVEQEVFANLSPGWGAQEGLGVPSEADIKRFSCKPSLSHSVKSMHVNFITPEGK